MSTVCYTFLLKKGTPYETKKNINRYIHRSNNTLDVYKRQLLDCYESDSDNKNLFKILDLEYKPEKVEVKNNPVKKRPSLLKKLRYYQNLINLQEQQNN